MDVTADELAGVVDLFGGLTRAELERALSEAAFRADGSGVDEAALEDAVEDALESFALVAYEPDGAHVESAGSEAGNGRPDGVSESELLVAGPTAFSTVPDTAEDVPHILDVEPRRPDRDALGETVRERFVADVTAAVDAGDADRCERLLDVSYDLEAWAPIDLATERDRLAEAIE